MRFGFFLVPFAIAASCGGVISGGSDGGSDAGGDVAVPSSCSTNQDCPTGYACQFPVSEGCAATLACMKVNPGACKSMPACACDGTSVGVCGPGAAKPVAHTGPCDQPPPPPDCGPACEVCDLTGFAPSALAEPTKATQACSSAEIASFVTACVGASATQSTCAAWEKMDAGACAACVLPNSSSSGPFRCDSTFCWINTGGCFDIVTGQVALESANGGSGSCGDLLSAAEQCDSYACGACAASGDYGVCTQNAQIGVCKSYEDATSSSPKCATDAGTSVCSPQSDNDWAAFINVFCGTGS